MGVCLRDNEAVKRRDRLGRVVQYCWSAQTNGVFSLDWRRSPGGVPSRLEKPLKLRWIAGSAPWIRPCWSRVSFATAYWTRYRLPSEFIVATRIPRKAAPREAPSACSASDGFNFAE